ncbi:MAG: hypothetical protein JAZ17_26975, partial [Candidatus Thiodiazotropha endolucinida]|nr:hypothetical protein [Candidatus Thiodiazotropha endolucinida]
AIKKRVLMRAPFFLWRRGRLWFEPFVRKERSDADAAAKRRRPEGVSRRRITRSEATQDAAVKRRRPAGVSAANQSLPSAGTQT